MKSETPYILLINPWIHDFAAYDFWAKPIGLLYLGAMLRDHGFIVSYMDCLNRFHPENPRSNPALRSGRGPYLKTRIPKPAALEDIPRYYSRYGISPDQFERDLQKSDRPDVILVTSLMTYWYPGTQETIRYIKKIWPSVPVILGGVYATLYYDHAVATSGADRVVTGPGESQLLSVIEDITGYSADHKTNWDQLDQWPYPSYDLQTNISYIPLITSIGCPFSCAYCASHFLTPHQKWRRPESVLNEVQYWHQRYDIMDFVFYDDALLVNATDHAIPLFESILRADIRVRFHTPNAVHIREINPKTAQLMFKAGFKTLRLGLESGDFEHRNHMDRKVTATDFKQATESLKRTGFRKEQVGAYLLAGLPGQTVSQVEESIHIVKDAGVTPVLAYYSPIPHTAMWEKAVASSRYDLESDPIFTNNAIFPCQKQPFSWEKLTYLKNLASG